LTVIIVNFEDFCQNNLFAAWCKLVVTAKTETAKTDIPDFTFYGEPQRSMTLEMLHCEPLVERSRQHNWKIKPHRHSGITQLFYLQQGSAEAHLDGILTQLSPPCVLVVPEGCVHDFNWTENAEGQVLSIAAPLLTKITQPLGAEGKSLKTAAVYNVSAHRQLVDSLFSSIAADYRQTLPTREIMLETLLTALVIYLSRQAEPAAATPDRQDRSRMHIAAFMQLVEKHYDEHWPVARYAEHLGITPPHLNTICRKLNQQSALEVVHQRLLLEAKRNLIYTGRTIAEIAYQLGFSDPSHFTRFFKNKSGENPRAFRRNP